MSDTYGMSNNHWKGGRAVINGYVHLYTPGHPRARTQTPYVAEHVLEVEGVLQRELPERHPVHHVNENRSDNCHENLVVCDSHSYHLLLHRRLRALKATGNPNAKQCCRCHEWTADVSYTRRVKGAVMGELSYHRACQKAHEQKRRDRAKASA